MRNSPDFHDLLGPPEAFDSRPLFQSAGHNHSRPEHMLLLLHQSTCQTYTHMIANPGLTIATTGTCKIPSTGEVRLTGPALRALEVLRLAGGIGRPAGCMVLLVTRLSATLLACPASRACTGGTMVATSGTGLALQRMDSCHWCSPLEVYVVHATAPQCRHDREDPLTPQALKHPCRMQKAPMFTSRTHAEGTHAKGMDDRRQPTCKASQCPRSVWRADALLDRAQRRHAAGQPVSKAPLALQCLCPRLAAAAP